MIMIVITALIGGVFFVGLQLGKRQTANTVHELNIAIEECVADIDAKCPALFKYTIMLEAQNAVLNKRLELCGKP